MSEDFRDRDFNPAELARVEQSTQEIGRQLLEQIAERHVLPALRHAADTALEQQLNLEVGQAAAPQLHEALAGVERRLAERGAQ